MSRYPKPFRPFSKRNLPEFWLLEPKRPFWYKVTGAIKVKKPRLDALNKAKL